MRDDEAVDILGFRLGDVDRVSRWRGDDGEIVPTEAIAYDTSVMAVLSTVLDVAS